MFKPGQIVEVKIETGSGARYRYFQISPDGSFVDLAPFGNRLND